MGFPVRDGDQIEPDLPWSLGGSYEASQSHGAFVAWGELLASSCLRATAPIRGLMFGKDS